MPARDGQGQYPLRDGRRAGMEQLGRQAHPPVLETGRQLWCIAHPNSLKAEAGGARWSVRPAWLTE